MSDDFESKINVILIPEGGVGSAGLWLNPVANETRATYTALQCYKSADVFVAEECPIRDATTGFETGVQILQSLKLPIVNLYGGDCRQSYVWADGFLTSAIMASGFNLTTKELPVAVLATNILSQCGADTNLLVSTGSGSELGLWCMAQDIPVINLSDIGMLGRLPYGDDAVGQF